MERHAALNPAIQRRLLVAAEIDAHLFLEREKNTTQIIRLLIVCPFRFRAVGKWLADIGMIGDTPNCPRNLARRKHRIDKAGANRAARHSIELRALFILSEGQTASRLDRTQPSCAIAACPRKDHAERTRATFFRERFKKMID